ncbi:alpha/beta fold hydrolase [Treponema putidum]|uniref:alpha/beta fold hydrolase n=1 Tax=Treponema putidum TaxID=221027 RepID=UPI003D89F89E
MNEKQFSTPYGVIHYWKNSFDTGKKTLVFLPGLTATHILFDKQIGFFQDKYNVLIWDAPGHGNSKPFELKFSMEDKARYLHGILETENIIRPILIGQSMGGYVSQMFMELYPGETRGFISIDSCSLKRETVTWFDIRILRHVEPIYRMYKWDKLIKAGSNGCAESEYGRTLMKEMMMTFDKDWYCKVAGHGFKILADALDSKRRYDIDCPAILLCGTKDKAGSAKRHDKKWTKLTGLPLIWIEGAGHNSNTDKPEEVNQIIENFVDGLQ